MNSNADSEKDTLEPQRDVIENTRLQIVDDTIPPNPNDSITSSRNELIEAESHRYVNYKTH